MFVKICFWWILYYFKIKKLTHILWVSFFIYLNISEILGRKSSLKEIFIKIRKNIDKIKATIIEIKANKLACFSILSKDLVWIFEFSKIFNKISFSNLLFSIILKLNNNKILSLSSKFVKN